jgi:pilus assembly protein CpaE
VENLLGEPFYHILPNDFHAASQSIKDGVPLVLRSGGSELGEALRDLVARYTNRVYDDAGDEHGPESWLARIFG